MRVSSNQAEKRKATRNCTVLQVGVNNGCYDVGRSGPFSQSITVTIIYSWTKHANELIFLKNAEWLIHREENQRKQTADFNVSSLNPKQYPSFDMKAPNFLI